ncbi:hypothetical protein HYT56_03375 [Candidatus Woesearchaeota archaeon]|nr:hypothetical protein [Candidatus Woesearchaeota archaeon]
MKKIGRILTKAITSAVIALGCDNFDSKENPVSYKNANRSVVIENRLFEENSPDLESKIQELREEYGIEKSKSDNFRIIDKQSSRRLSKTTAGNETPEWINFFQISGDFNDDGKVSFEDLVLLAQGYNLKDLKYDLSGDGIIDKLDFGIFVGQFGRELKNNLEIKAFPTWAYGYNNISNMVGAKLNEGNAYSYLIDGKIVNSRMIQSHMVYSGDLLMRLNLDNFAGKNVKIGMVEHEIQQIGDFLWADPVQWGEREYRVPKVIYRGKDKYLILRFFEDQEQYEKIVPKPARDFDAKNPNHLVYFGYKPKEVEFNIFSPYNAFMTIEINGNPLNLNGDDISLTTSYGHAYVVPYSINGNEIRIDIWNGFSLRETIATDQRIRSGLNILPIATEF